VARQARFFGNNAPTRGHGLMLRDDAIARERGAERPDAPLAPEQPPRRIDSKTLLGAAQEIEINHVGQIYRLRRTTLGKLILTK
jgi:hemin uptake protein HemP